MTASPAPGPVARVLLRGGSVYSPVDPFATALLLEGDMIAWIGSEGAALAMADGVHEVIELDGALVAPFFVDMWAAGPVDPLPRGTGARHGPSGTWAAPVGPVAFDVPAERIVLAGAEGQQDPAAIRARVHAIGAGGARPVLVAPDAEAASAALQALDGPVAPLLVLSALHRADVAALAAARTPVCLLPGPDGGLDRLPVAALAAAGVPLSFGSGTTAVDPWSAVAAAVHHRDHEQRISARAAFAAHTRGGWRALGEPGRGVLAPGLPAHFAIWSVGDLVVQAPDDRIEAWSTDPRSGTPGLPDLSPGAPRPQCLRTVVWGRTRYRA